MSSVTPTAASRLSTAFADGSTVRAALAMPLACGLLVLAGCGGTSAHDQVEAYITQVSEVQARTNASLVKASETYAAFARGEMRNAAGRKKLSAAEKSIRDARAQLGELKPPSDAKKLHQRLLRYYDDSADLAYETTLLGRFEAAAQSALRWLPALNRRLERSLASRPGARAQAAALVTYKDGLDRVLRRLRALQPPPILQAAHSDQVARLERTGRLAERLRGALGEQDARMVARLLLRFRRSGGSSSREVERLSATAVRAYDKRVQALTSDAVAVERERRRLEAALD